MYEMNDIVKLAVDAYHGKVQKYSMDESMDVLRQALVEANGGSTKLDYKAMRDGRCAKVFALVETILSRTIWDGLQGDEHWMNLVEYRNMAEGDKNIYVVNDANLFRVDEVADGTQGVRRQRLAGRSEVSLPTKRKIVKIYEELDRVLAGRVDFNEFIKLVAESFKAELNQEIASIWTAATAQDMGGTAYFPVAGAYDEDALLETIAHVEAAAGGKTATLLCTKKAARMLAPSVHGADSQSDLYNLGYFGKFYSNPVVITPQRHKIGTTEFLMPDNVITIVAGDDKPIKITYEGDPLVLAGNPMDNADLTNEYAYTEKYGIGIVLAGGNAGIGRYEFT